MVSPQHCCEGLEKLLVAGNDPYAASAQASSVIAFTAADDSRQPPLSTPASNEDECFCCCSHILPTVHFDVALFNDEPTLSVLTDALLPVPPSQRPFHPPRLS
jgi:hypothetical protein